MSNRDNDELARALAGLSSGDHPAHDEHHDEHGEHAHEEAEAHATPQAPSAPPPPPAPPRAAAPVPAARPSVPRPSAPVPGSASRPPAPPRSAAPARPSATMRPAAPVPAMPSPGAIARPARPSAPTPPTTASGRPATPPRPTSSGPARPAVPVLNAAEQVPAAEEVESEFSNVTETLAEDDVLMAVPPPPAESLAHVEHHETPHFRPRLIPKSLGMRQTFVPILLTVGTMFCIGGVVKLIVGEDSPLHDAPSWLAPGLFVLGAVFFGLAVMNIFQLKTMIDKRKTEG